MSVTMNKSLLRTHFTSKKEKGPFHCWGLEVERHGRFKKYRAAYSLDRTSQMALRALHRSKYSDFAQIPSNEDEKCVFHRPENNTRAFTPEWEGRIFEFSRRSSLDTKASQGQLGQPRRLRPFDEQVSASRSIHGSRWQVLMVFMWRPTLVQNTPSISMKSDKHTG